MKATIFISMLCLVLSIMTVSIMCLCKSIEINKSLDVATKTENDSEQSTIIMWADTQRVFEMPEGDNVRVWFVRGKR